MFCSGCRVQSACSDDSRRPRFIFCYVFLQGQAAEAASAATSAEVRAHVPVPSQDAIKEAILKRKKLALLKRLDDGEDAADGEIED